MHSPQELTLRNYLPDDYQDVSCIMQQAGLSDEYCSQQELIRWSGVQPDSIIVAAIGEEVVGSVFFQDGIIPYVYRLSVKQSYLRQGIGSALLSEAERRAKEAGHKSIELNIGEDHPELIKWYEARGYQVRFTLIDMTKRIES